MSQTHEQPLRSGASTRRERLESILAESTASAPSPVGEPPRFAALTSEGPPEAALSVAPRLVRAADRAALAESLRAELEEGRLAHGRVWDLDAEAHPWGNLGLAYEVAVGEEPDRVVHAVRVEGRDPGLHLFADRLDAEAFCRAVRRGGGQAHLGEALLHDNRGADRLIDAERGH